MTQRPVSLDSHPGSCLPIRKLSRRGKKREPLFGCENASGKTCCKTYLEPLKCLPANEIARRLAEELSNCRIKVDRLLNETASCCSTYDHVQCAPGGNAHAATCETQDGYGWAVFSEMVGLLSHRAFLNCTSAKATQGKANKVHRS